MGRKPGGKNPPGHRAGGARPGAGRPRRTPGQVAAARYRRTATIPPQTVEEGTQTDGERVIPVSALHPAYLPFMNHPHDQGLIVLPVASALQLASAYGPQSIPHPPYPFGPIPRAVQDYQAYLPCHPAVALLPVHEPNVPPIIDRPAGPSIPDQLATAPGPLPTQKYSTKRTAGDGIASYSYKRRRIMPAPTGVPEEHSSIPNSADSTSAARAGASLEPVEPPIGVAPSSEATPALESQTGSCLSLTLSPTSGPNFAPSSASTAQLDQSTRQPIVSSTFVVQDEPIKKPTRSRRRCVICLQNGYTDLSLSCPGRGERARCPRAGSKVTVGGPIPSSEVLTRAAEHSSAAMARQSSSSFSPIVDRMSDHMVSGDLPRSSVTKIAPTESRISLPILQGNAVVSQPAPMTALMHLPGGYAPVAFYPGSYTVPEDPPGNLSGNHQGPEVHRSVMYVTPNEPSKRRPRRCVVCSVTGRPELGFTCPGRGSRRLCKYYVPGRHSTVALSEDDIGDEHAHIDSQLASMTE